MMADSDQLGKALYSASDFYCENRVFIAYLLPKLKLTEEVNNHIISFLDEFSPAKEMHEYLKTSICDDDYLAIQLQAKEMHESLIASIRDDPNPNWVSQLKFPGGRIPGGHKKEHPDEEYLNYLFLKQNYNLNGGEETALEYYITDIVNSFYGDDDVHRRSLKAAMFVLDKGKPAKQVLEDVSTMDLIVKDKLPVDSTRCDSCTRRNTRTWNTAVRECSSCSRTCCGDCRLQHLIREDNGCEQCLRLVYPYYHDDDLVLEESERTSERTAARRRMIETLSRFRAPKKTRRNSQGLY